MLWLIFSLLITFILAGCTLGNNQKSAKAISQSISDLKNSSYEAKVTQNENSFVFQFQPPDTIRIPKI